MEEFLVHEVAVRPGQCSDALIIGAGAYPHLVGGEGCRTPDHEDMKQLTSPPVSARRVAGGSPSTSNTRPKPLRSVTLLLSAQAQRPFTNPKTGAEHPVGLASADNVTAAIKRWKARGDESADNRLLFYFCGHGIAQGPTCPCSCRTSAPIRTTASTAPSTSGSCT